MASPQTTPVLIAAAELARMLSVSKPTVWRMKEAGKLPPAIALTAQCVRWRHEDVLSWIGSGCPAGTVPLATQPVAAI